MPLDLSNELAKKIVEAAKEPGVDRPGDCLDALLDKDRRLTRGQRVAQRMAGKADAGLITDQILAMTRGED